MGSQLGKRGLGSPPLQGRKSTIALLTNLTGWYMMPTEPIMSCQSKQQRIEQFERLCRERGLPLTTQRRTVFELICDRRDHPTADQIYGQVRRRLPAISRTTVYRILENLVELGVIARICHPGSAGRFDPKIRRHHHLVCVHCETIIDLELPRLNRLALPDVSGHGFEIRDYHIHFRGTCSRCRNRVAAEQRRRGETGGHCDRSSARAKFAHIAGRRKSRP